MSTEQETLQTLNELKDLLKKVPESKKERAVRRFGPWVLVAVIWIAGCVLLANTQDSWGIILDSKDPKDFTGQLLWGTVVLRSVVLVAAFVCMTVVSVAAVRREW